MERAEKQAGVLYAVFPGEVASKYDGQWHYVGARQLMHLYGVPPHECVIIRSVWDHAHAQHLIPLFPRYDGNYSVARNIEEMSWE